MAETKSAVDYGIDTLHRVIDDTMVRVKSTAKLIERVQQEPWIMFGSAILLGYVIGSLNRADILVPQRVDRQIRESCRPERPASVAPLP